MTYAGLPDRVTALCALLEQDRGDAERVVDICRDLEARARGADGELAPHDDDPALQRELGRLVEVLSRRSAKAIAAARLGRIALADLARDVRGRQTAIAECDALLTMFGL